MLTAAGVAPECLQLEITESRALPSGRGATLVADELRDMGVSIAIDDFGTGFSSLVQLQRLPVDEIKIDRSFVATMAHSASDAAIVRSTIDLARNLGLRVTAEGVETEDARARLQGMGCQLVQGYHLCRPLPAERCARVIREHRHRPGARGMKSLVAAATLGLLLLIPAAAAAAPYVVVLRDGAAGGSRAVDKVAARAGAKPGLTYDTALQGFAADLSPGQLNLLRRDPDVAFVEPDVTVFATGLAGPVAKGETVPPGIKRVGGVSGGLVHVAAAPVAVVDSGIDLANSDLAARPGINCVKAGTSPADDSGHGTNVAGVIGARNAGTGAVGVAPGTPVYAVKVLGKTGTGTLSQILCGINWVTANAAALGIRVANMSIEGAGSDDGACGNVNGDSWHKAICASVAAGVTWIVSAGNAPPASSARSPPPTRRSSPSPR